MTNVGTESVLVVGTCGCDNISKTAWEVSEMADLGVGISVAFAGIIFVA